MDASLRGREVNTRRLIVEQAALLPTPSIGSRSMGSRRPAAPRTGAWPPSYGEWLRREGRRIDARAAMKAAYDMFVEMGGMDGFADRPRGELVGTRRHGAEAHGRDDARPDRTGGADRLARSRGILEPGDRQPVVPQPAHRRVAHEPGVQQARRQVAASAARPQTWRPRCSPTVFPRVRLTGVTALTRRAQRPRVSYGRDRGSGGRTLGVFTSQLLLLGGIP